MSLRLSEQDQAEYNRLCESNRIAKEQAIARNDAKAARQARQANSRLYDEFKRREIPLPPIEEQSQGLPELTLEERVEQIEQRLGLNRWGI